MALALTVRERRWLAWLVVAIVVVRLVSLAAYPLTDPTEARYGEIARKMLETRQWIMPQFEYGVPFWGKPPLSTWLSAAAMGVFGVNEFAARLPSSAADDGLRRAGLLARRIARGSRRGAVVAGDIRHHRPDLRRRRRGDDRSRAGFRHDAGDGGLLGRGRRPCSRNGALRATRSSSVLPIGLLGKGPVAAILTAGADRAPGRCGRDDGARCGHRVPWITGTLLLAALVLPWYWAAERATPGFLEYFLVGEHWKRFTQPGWTGDLYGAAHARPRGMIWVFWLGVALPWSVVAVGWLIRAATTRRQRLAHLVATIRGGPTSCSGRSRPMLFFTVSGNVLPTYVLPGLPALALLVADVWRPLAEDAVAVRSTVRHVLVTGVVICIAFRRRDRRPARPDGKRALTQGIGAHCRSAAQRRRPAPGVHDAAAGLRAVLFARRRDQGRRRSSAGTVSRRPAGRFLRPARARPRDAARGGPRAADAAGAISANTGLFREVPR